MLIIGIEDFRGSNLWQSHRRIIEKIPGND